MLDLSSWIIILSSDKERDYKKLQNGEISVMRGIPYSLKPSRNFYTEEIQIKTPDGRTEYWKEKYSFFSGKYVKVRQNGFAMENEDLNKHEAFWDKKNKAFWENREI